MSSSSFEIKIDRVIVVGPELDAARSARLRALIAEEMRERMETVHTPVKPFEGEQIRIDLPGLPLDTIDWERRVARATADAVLGALRGKTP